MIKLMYDWIKSQGYQPIIIATKLDKINRSTLTYVKMVKDGLKMERMI